MGHAPNPPLEFAPFGGLDASTAPLSYTLGTMPSVITIPPLELDGARVERFASVLGLPRKVTLLTGGVEVEAPSAIALCRYSGEESVYLFHCSDSWQVLAAGHFSSLIAATEAAERGYLGVSSRWIDHA